MTRSRLSTLSLLLLASCFGNPEEPPEPRPEDLVTDPAVPVPGDTLVLAVGFDPGNLNPVVAPYALSAMIADQVQPGLVRRGSDKGSLLYEPMLAESWTFSETNDSLTYTLREGLKWADGEPLTSEDVAFTYELIADEAVASNWFGDSKYIAAVETPDPRTVTFRFSRPQNPLLQQGYTVRGIVPEHVLADADRATLRGHPSGRDPLPSGPFRVTSWTANDRVVLERNPAAIAPFQPYLERVVFKILPEYSTRLLELERGAVDMVPSIEISDIPRVREDKSIDLVRMPSAVMEYVGFDLTDPRFDDVRVRTALTMSIDRSRLIRDYLSIDGTSYGHYCVGTISPVQAGWYASEITPLPYEPRKAIELLESAGWRDTDNDGIRERRGTELRFSLMVQTGSAFLKRMAVLVQAYWESVGAKVDIEMVDPAPFADRARRHEFEAILWSFGANPKIDPSIQWSTGGQYNWFQYSNPEVDALIRKGLETTDIEAAQKAFREAQVKIHEDQPVTFLYWRDDVVAIDKRFRDVQMNTFTLLHHLEEWYVPYAEQRYHNATPPPPVPGEDPPGEQSGLETSRGKPL